MIEWYIDMEKRILFHSIILMWFKFAEQMFLLSMQMRLTLQ